MEKYIRINVNCWGINVNLLKYYNIIMDSGIKYKWRLVEHQKLNTRRKKYNLEYVYFGNKDIPDGTLSPYKLWFKNKENGKHYKKLLSFVKEYRNQHNNNDNIDDYDDDNDDDDDDNVDDYDDDNDDDDDIDFNNFIDIRKDKEYKIIRLYISKHNNKLHNFLNFENNNLMDIIKEHNNKLERNHRKELRRLENMKKSNENMNYDFKFNERMFERKFEKSKVRISDIDFMIDDIEHFIKNIDKEIDLSILKKKSFSITNRKIKDIYNTNIYPPELESIYIKYNSNENFKKCIDDILTLEDEELIKILEEKNVDVIVELLHRISELSPHDYMKCMDHVGDYCGSDVVHNYMQVITLIFNYFGSSIDINSKTPIEEDTDFIQKTLPYVKKIYHKIIINAKTINHYKIKSGKCNINDNIIIDRYKKIYDSLFDSKSCETSYALFDNYKLPGMDRITKYATENTLIFVIILIFISFIFSKIVTLMSVNPVTPINKNIL